MLIFYSDESRSEKCTQLELTRRQELLKMAEQDRLSASVIEKPQAQQKADKYFVQKAEKMRALKGSKILALKGRNKLVGLTLVGCVLGIYGYTMFSVRQGKMMEAFDKMPE